MALDWTVIIVAVIGAISGLGSLALQWRKSRLEGSALNVENETKLSKAALDLLEPLQKRIDELEAAREREKTRMADLERRVAELECELRDERNIKDEIRAGAERLVHQVESLGGKPVYVPPKRGGTGELKAAR